MSYGKLSKTEIETLSRKLSDVVNKKTSDLVEAILNPPLHTVPAAYYNTLNQVLVPLGFDADAGFPVVTDQVKDQMRLLFACKGFLDKVSGHNSPQEHIRNDAQAVNVTLGDKRKDDFGYKNRHISYDLKYLVDQFLREEDTPYKRYRDQDNALAELLDHMTRY